MSPIDIAFLLGGLIVGLMAFIGFMSAVKGTPVHCVEEFGDGQPAAVDEPGFRTALELLSRTPLHAGHDVEIFVNGNETYPRLWGDLRAARESITLQLYYCEPGRMADDCARSSSAGLTPACGSSSCTTRSAAPSRRSTSRR